MNTEHFLSVQTAPKEEETEKTGETKPLARKVSDRGVGSGGGAPLVSDIYTGDIRFSGL